MIIDHGHVPNMHPDSLQTSDRRYGDMSIGATFRFVTTDYFDKKTVRTGSQLYQQSYNSLLPPYVHIGVGKSINYIESFNAAISINNINQVCIKTPLIPNSQMIVFSDDKMDSA